MFQRILVGLDGSPLAETVLPYVTALAKGLGSEVTLIHVTHLPEGMDGEQHRAALLPVLQRDARDAEGYLKRTAERLTSAGIKATYVVSVGDAPAEIVAYAQREGMDLIALATHGRGGLGRLIYGSVADKVLHTTRTPLLLVRPSEGATAVPQGIAQVLVPLDGSPLAESALPYAEAIAAELKVPVVLVRAVEPVYMFNEPGPGSAEVYQDLLDGLQGAADDYVKQVSQNLTSKGLTVQTVTNLGLPGTEIETQARAHPGTLIVMSTRGRTGVVGFFLGSVARRVVQDAVGPVLVVRPATPSAGSA